MTRTRPDADPRLEAELGEIARQLRAELGVAAAPPPPRRARPTRPPRRRSTASVARFVVATVVPGLILIGLTVAMGLTG